MNKLDFNKIKNDIQIGDYLFLTSGEILIITDYDPAINLAFLSDDTVADLEEMWKNDEISEIKRRSKRELVKIFKCSLEQEMINTLVKRTNDVCCLCVTFKELTMFTLQDFIDFMKRQYRRICAYELKQSKINSWIDEYQQINQFFIPRFKEESESFLDYYIIFELMLPQNISDLSSNTSCYSDAVIVGENGFVVLEFKQREKDAAKIYWKEALKYTRRLKYHKIGRHQRRRYTYIVCTKEHEDKIWPFENKKNLWYGNSRSVVDDLCSRFFSCETNFKNIENWLMVGFKEKI